MYIHDSHVHTKYSFDGAKDTRGEVDTIVKNAIERGIDEISFTDHVDIDDILDGIYPPFDADAVMRDVFAAREEYRGKIRINCGVELGQPHARAIEARAFLDKYKFDFVIGSLHNLMGYPDFYFLKLDLMCDEQLDYIMRRTLSELSAIVDFGGISTLAHITYVERYLIKCGVKLDIMKYADGFAEIFNKLIKNGISLEINTSGLRSGAITMPGEELIRLYRECGGELITLGSDAHSADDVGAGIEETARILREYGFKSQTVVRDGKLSQIEL